MRTDLQALYSAWKDDTSQLAPLLSAVTHIARTTAAKLNPRAPREDHEDAAQEIALKIWAWLPYFDGRASLKTVIGTFTRNHIEDMRRKEQARPDRDKPVDTFSEPVPCFRVKKTISPESYERLRIATEGHIGKDLLDLLMEGHSVEQASFILDLNPVEIRSKIARLRPTIQ